MIQKPPQLNTEQTLIPPAYETVLKSIKDGNLAMKPRWHFLLKASMLISAIFVMVFALLYVISFAVFTMKQTGAWYVVDFGTRGWYTFLSSIPWILGLCTIIFLITLEMLVRRYSFGYRMPLLISAIAIIFITITGGILVAQTQLHRSILKYAEQNRLPFANSFYRGFAPRPIKEAHIGTIIEINGKGFIVQSPWNDTFLVATTSGTRFPFGYAFKAGDSVVIFGMNASGTVHAMGMRKLE